MKKCSRTLYYIVAMTCINKLLGIRLVYLKRLGRYRDRHAIKRIGFMAELSLQSPFPEKHYFSSIWVCRSCGPNAKAICLNKHWSIWQKNVVNILALNYRAYS